MQSPDPTAFHQLGSSLHPGRAELFLCYRKNLPLTSGYFLCSSYTFFISCLMNVKIKPRDCFLLNMALYLVVEWWFPLDAAHSCFLALAVGGFLIFRCLWFHSFFPESCFHHFLWQIINIHLIQWPLAVKHLNQAILQ